MMHVTNSTLKRSQATTKEKHIYTLAF